MDFIIFFLGEKEKDKKKAYLNAAKNKIFHKVLH